MIDPPDSISVTDAPKITIVLTFEATPRVEILDGGGATWARLADWLAASGQGQLLLGLLAVVREAKEPTS